MGKSTMTKQYFLEKKKCVLYSSESLVLSTLPDMKQLLKGLLNLLTLGQKSEDSSNKKYLSEGLLGTWLENL